MRVNDNPQRIRYAHLPCGYHRTREEKAFDASGNYFLHLNRLADVHGFLRIWPRCKTEVLSGAPVRHRERLLLPPFHFASLVLHRARGFFLTGICTFLWSTRMGSFSHLLGSRVGEASNPGPPVLNWSLQVRNIVSASGHLDELTHGSDSCVVWSETCATSSTTQSISKLARQHKSFAVCSAPSGSRQFMGSTVTGRGHACGSLIYTRDKAMNLNNLWSPQTFSTGRVADALLSIGNTQLRVIAVYGYNSNIPNYQGLNEVLFQDIFSKAAAFDCPTIIAGDFNHDLCATSLWSHYSAVGFLDLGSYIPALMNQAPEFTYRGKSRLDYCICNASAARHVQSFKVNPRGFTDHGSLHVNFSFSTSRPTRWIWSMPMDLSSYDTLLHAVQQSEVDNNTMANFRSAIMHNDLDAAFQMFAKSFEHAATCASQHLGQGPLSAKYFGRTRGKLVKARPRSFQLSCDGSTLSDRTGFRRRQKVLRWVRELAWSFQASGTLGAPQLGLWQKILNSSAFPGGFASWALNNDIVEFVPERPSLVWVQQLAAAMTLEEQHWTQVVKRDQARLHRLFRDSDWSQGGRWHAAAVKPPMASTLMSLVESTDISVAPLRAVKGQPACFRVSEDCKVQPGDVWDVAGHRLLVASKQGDNVKLAGPVKQGMSVKTVKQLAWNGDPSFVANQVAHYWNGFWMSNKAPDTDFLTTATQMLPHLPEFDCIITPDKLYCVLKALPRHKARGTDGFSNGELKSLSADHLSMLLTLFNSITTSGTWPMACTQAVVSLLAKTQQPQSASDARPITILATAYRVWAKCITAKLLVHLMPHFPHGLFGSVPGKSSMDLAFSIQAAIEESFYSGKPFVGVGMDLSKAYNTLSRDVLCVITKRLGWPASLWKTYNNFLESLHRYFKVDHALFGPCRSKVGVPEGCPNVHYVVCLGIS